MELYILDSLLRRVEVIDRFESLIWTDRFIPTGDFQLVIHATPKLRSQFIADETQVMVNESDSVGLVETVEDKVGDDGRAMLTISGRTLECILDDRVTRISMNGLDTAPSWGLVQTPGNLARHVFTQICALGVMDKRDIIPFLDSGTIYPPDTIAEPSDIIRIEVEPDTVYNVIKNLCVSYGLGFRLVRNPETARLHFIVYAGSDRTSAQRKSSPVIFSPSMDTLTNSTELISSRTYKNVAHVVAPEGSVMVYADEADPAKSGFKRHVLLVKVDSVRQNAEDNKLTVDEILRRKGKEALASAKLIRAFDGEIPKFGYKNGIDYRLGDIVEMRKSNDYGRYMRITEQIFSSDSEGDRSFPTLAHDTFITPGSWSSWNGEIEWIDAEGYWIDAAKNITKGG